MFASWSLLYLYFYGNPLEEHPFVPPVHTFVDGTRHTTSTESSHPHFHRIRNIRKKFHPVSFYPKNISCFHEYFIFWSRVKSQTLYILPNLISIYPTYSNKLHFLLPLLTFMSQTLFSNNLHWVALEHWIWRIFI